MANSHIASDKGLQLVNDAREDKGWNRTDQRFLDEAKVSKATLNRFYAQQQPIKQETIVAICNAVGINNWKNVVEKTGSLAKKWREQKIEVTPTPNSLTELDRELRAWFKALRYEIELDYLVETEEYFE
jgi:hypothetical protein